MSPIFSMRSCVPALVWLSCFASCRSGSESVVTPVDAASRTDSTEAKSSPPPSGLYALRSKSLEGGDVDLARFAGKVSLVVNVASECGFTPQYEGLQRLHKELSGRGFQVLGFPCNDFGGQEPGTSKEIAAFCSTRFGVTFPMFEKVEITKGDDRSPIYRYLIDATGQTPSWNFCKYLVGKDGKVIGFWRSNTAADSKELRAAIEKAL